MDAAAQMVHQGPVGLAQVARTGSVPISLSTQTGETPLINKATRDEVTRSLDDTETW
jgi:hypothetical protein